MKTYKIGEIAKMLGISSETIRNYEKKGLINPYKEEDSNYRHYDIVQINHLMNLQKFHKFGYMLQEVKNLVLDTSMTHLQTSLEEKKIDLLNEAVYMNLKINSLEETIHSMKQAQNAKKGFFIGKRPAMYRMNYQKNYELLTEARVKEELIKWLKHTDLPFMSGSVSVADIIRGNSAFDFGFCMDKEAADYIGIEENEVVKFYDECPAIIFYYEATPFSDMTSTSKKVIEYARKRGLRISGESVSRVIFANWKQDNYFISHLVWVPFKKG